MRRIVRGQDNDLAGLAFLPYRKKPVVVTAALILDEAVEIETLEGVMVGNIGDMLICGINGELYPCKPDIFSKTYEPAS